MTLMLLLDLSIKYHTNEPSSGKGAGLFSYGPGFKTVLLLHRVMQVPRL